MNAPEPTSPRQRLNTLLAIPERERTDAEWDEINDLEIRLAPGNREDGPRQSQNQNQNQNQNQAPRRNVAAPNGFNKSAAGTPHKKPFKKQRKAPRSRPPTTTP